MSIDITTLSNEDKKDVIIWQMLAGKITEIKILGDLFAVRDSLPLGLDPVQVAIDFLTVFDIEKTKMIRKVKVPEPEPGKIYYSTKANEIKEASKEPIIEISREIKETDKEIIENKKPEPEKTYYSSTGIHTIKETSTEINERKRTKNDNLKSKKPKQKRNPPFIEIGQSIGSYHGMLMYKERIIDIYKHMPKEFTSQDLREYFYKLIKNPDTAKNRQNAYSTFLVKEGILTVIHKIHAGSRMKTYRFVAPPFGIEHTIKPEFSIEDMQKQKINELEAMRRAN